jgi:hypothetical protein
MSLHARRLAVLLSPLVLAAGCAPSGQQHTTQVLNQRLFAHLAPAIVLGQVALQPLPDGARVTLLGSSRFPREVRASDLRDTGVPASVVEALLDPRLMRIEVADTSALPDTQRVDRVRDARQYFAAYGLGQTLTAAAPLPPPPRASAGPVVAGPVPAGLVLTISVECPPGHDPFAIANGLADPVCD